MGFEQAEVEYKYIHQCLNLADIVAARLNQADIVAAHLNQADIVAATFPQVVAAGYADSHLLPCSFQYVAPSVAAKVESVETGIQIPAAH